jgi:hypothetical protein
MSTTELIGMVPLPIMAFTFMSANGIEEGSKSRRVRKEVNEKVKQDSSRTDIESSEQSSSSPRSALSHSLSLSMPTSRVTSIHPGRGRVRHFRPLVLDEIHQGHQLEILRGFSMEKER